jgi:hypothetical protein
MTTALTTTDRWRVLFTRPVYGPSVAPMLRRAAQYLLGHGIDREIALRLVEALNETHCEPSIGYVDLLRLVDDVVAVTEKAKDG